MIQAPLDVQLWALQLLFQLLLQWSNIWDALALQTLKCSITSYFTLVLIVYSTHEHEILNSIKIKTKTILGNLGPAIGNVGNPSTSEI